MLKIILVLDRLRPNRNNVVINNNVGNKDISSGSFEKRALIKIMVDIEILTMSNILKIVAGNGIIIKKISPTTKSPNTISPDLNLTISSSYSYFYFANYI